MKILKNISLKDKNWFRSGGNAKFYCEPTNNDDFVTALTFAKQNQLSIFILGTGANILISDDGFDGLVIHPQNNSITTNNNTVTAGAGVTIETLINYCLNNNLIGLEEFSGIPGTVGGSVFINIHYFEFLLSQYILHATILDKETNIITQVPVDWFNFGYNTSTLHNNNHILLDATFKLTKATPLETAYAKGKSAEISRHRSRRYPSSGTCGSFFRNFHPSEVNNGIIYIAYYLDKLGIKGSLSHGEAKVSHQHANMLVNTNNATSNDIINLAKTMQSLVYNQFQILPVPECQLIGFSIYPLLK